MFFPLWRFELVYWICYFEEKWLVFPFLSGCPWIFKRKLVLRLLKAPMCSQEPHLCNIESCCCMGRWGLDMQRHGCSPKHVGWAESPFGCLYYCVWLPFYILYTVLYYILYRICFLFLFFCGTLPRGALFELGSLVNPGNE